MSTSTYVSPSMLGEAHQLNRYHARTLDALRECCDDLDRARDEKTVSEALITLTDIAHSYSAFTDSIATYWRRVFQVVDEEQVSTDTFYRIMVWAGVLEAEKHTGRGGRAG